MVTTGVWLVMAAGLAMHGGDAFLISPGPSLNGRMSALPLRLKCASLQLQPDSLLKADNRRRSRPSCLCMQEDKDAGMGFSEESYTMSLQDEVDDDDVVLKLPKPDPSMDVQGLQLRLLKACCGLDRGAAAGESERRSVFDAVSNLEDLVMDGREFEEDGLWRLIFSSALSAGSGSGGGAGKNSLPIFQTADTARLSLGPGSIVGQVYQRVQRRKKSLDNIVEFVLRAPFVSALQLKTVLNLNHRLESNGKNKHKIILRNVTVRNPGGPIRTLGLKPLSLPVIESISEQGAGVFETTYCDDTLRITRGDRGELRIFCKE